MDQTRANTVLNVVLLDEAPRGQSLERLLLESGCNLVGSFGYSLRVEEHLRKLEYDVALVAVREPLVRALRAVEFVALINSDRPVLAYVDRNLRVPVFELAREIMRAGAWDMFTQPIKPMELFDLLWRATSLRDRRLLARRSGMEEVIPPGHITTVFGGRGGTGKSTLALNLSYGHAKMTNERILLVDTDSQRGGVTAFLDPQVVRSVPPLSLSSFLDEDICDALEQYAIYSFGPLTILRLSEGDQEVSSLIQEDGVSLLDKLSLFYDHIYVDTPPSWSPEVQESVRSASLALFVVHPAVDYLIASKNVLERAREITFFTEKVKVVINQADTPGALSREAVEDATGLPVIWQIPRDPSAVTAGRLGIPLVESLPRSKAAQSILGLLYAIAGVRRPPAGGPLARLFGRVRPGIQRGEREARGAVTAPEIS